MYKTYLNMIRPRILLLHVLFFSVLCINIFSGDQVFAFDVNNDFQPNAFPRKVSTRTFSIPLDPDEVMVVIPSHLKSSAGKLKTLLKEKCGREIPFHMADDLTSDELRDRHLIVLGNIMNNRWALELYKCRQAFSDAYFPGKEGVIIHPTTSLWAPDRDVLVIGVSHDNDLIMGFETFVDHLEEKAETIETLHYLKTSLAFPKPPDSVDAILESTKKNFHTFPAWSSIPFWGLCYYLSGDKKWAEHFRDGCYALYERAQKSGRWVPESWTTLYYELWRYFRVWPLLDEDPFFTEKDRTIIEELLWAYTWFLDADENFPYFKKDFFSDLRATH